MIRSALFQSEGQPFTEATIVTNMDPITGRKTTLDQVKFDTGSTSRAFLNWNSNNYLRGIKNFVGDANTSINYIGNTGATNFLRGNVTLQSSESGTTTSDGVTLEATSSNGLTIGDVNDGSNTLTLEHGTNAWKYVTNGNEIHSFHINNASTASLNVSLFGIGVVGGGTFTGGLTMGDTWPLTLGTGNTIRGNGSNIEIDTQDLQVSGEITGTRIRCTSADGGIVALTTNDGKGNANVTFNHEGGIPDRNGSSYRIQCSADQNYAKMTFELKNGTLKDTVTTLDNIMELKTSVIEMNVPLTITNHAFPSAPLFMWEKSGLQVITNTSDANSPSTLTGWYASPFADTAYWSESPSTGEVTIEVAGTYEFSVWVQGTLQAPSSGRAELNIDLLIDNVPSARDRQYAVRQIIDSDPTKSIDDGSAQINGYFKTVSAGTVVKITATAAGSPSLGVSDKSARLSIKKVR